MASTMKVAVAANYLAQVEFGRRSLDERIGGHGVQLMADDHPQRQSCHRLADPQPRRPADRWQELATVAALARSTAISPSLLAAKRDLWDVRDSSTPEGDGRAARRLDNGTCCAVSRAYLLRLMAPMRDRQEPDARAAAGGTPVEHKTGTLSGYSSDVGFITLPDGRRLAVAFFARRRANRPRTDRDGGAALL